MMEKIICFKADFSLMQCMFISDRYTHSSYIEFIKSFTLVVMSWEILHYFPESALFSYWKVKGGI